jgi:Glutaredoxin-like domain (DUF836)
MITNLYLYSTSHCHLCEVAHALILQALKIPKLKTVEISDDEQLLALYGLKIPVLQRQDTLAELNWPFSESDLVKFVA